MLTLLLSPDYAPFAIAFVVMLGIGLIEAIGLGLGHFDFDTDLDAHPGPSLIDWLGLGRGLPILVWLTSLLGCFTVAGFAVQQIATAATGAPLHWSLASAAALVIGGVANMFAAAGLARIFPGYESTVILADDLLRHRGTVLEGAAARGRPARAKVVDRFGQAHYVMIEPHHDQDVIVQGQTALLVRKEGQLFFAVPDAHPLLQTI
ncbi:YqiJ family protein [Sphingomonas sp. LB-2]|uniref:YqiJ family protein n=1 Tax=Sphingomonas caeni TaxID=2984949 RepID=UPI00223080B9|nr:YqiJ family protein [Sphingomonas caeni]MCW3847158.1 YqiJ family protein [Sphingomonas caeni]